MNVAEIQQSNSHRVPSRPPPSFSDEHAARPATTKARSVCRSSVPTATVDYWGIIIIVNETAKLLLPPPSSLSTPLTTLEVHQKRSNTRGSCGELPANRTHRQEHRATPSSMLSFLEPNLLRLRREGMSEVDANPGGRKR